MQNKNEIVIFWFRRDLRLQDNVGLNVALQQQFPVLPIFIFDTNILSELEDSADGRVHFIYNELLRLQNELAAYSSAIHILYDTPIHAFARLCEIYTITKVIANHDYEPYARERDSLIQKFLEQKGIQFVTCKDQVIFEKDEVLKDDGKPYTVFTPYSKKWRFKLGQESFSVNLRLKKHFFEWQSSHTISLQDMGFVPVISSIPQREIGNELLSQYAENRDFPSKNATSHISVHLRFGTISIRQLLQQSLSLSHTFVNELIWRDFYFMILWHFPHVVTNSFRAEYDNIKWRNNESEFNAWCMGETGYPIVDAGMRQLNKTGYMHNRVRMIVASFLTKHLLIDWRWGEAYFAKKLLDFDLAANNGGWQWAAGSGCDAAPYFRIFNPYLQTKKFDPDLKYIRTWVPEFDDLSYTSPIVSHEVARKRCLQVYGAALKK